MFGRKMDSFSKSSFETLRPNTTDLFFLSTDRLFKRLLDISASCLGLILCAPLFVIVALSVKRDSPGPVFYRGRRVGKDGKEFNILKFRTMFEQPDSFRGPKVTAQNDPRITELGRWLRETKLNELPQLWNVLRGEMSFVGPRPEDPDFVKTWTEEVRNEILSVRPGITSPASVLYRNEEALLAEGKVMETYLSSIVPTKIRLDQLYVRHRTFWADLDILLWTLMVVLVKSFAPAEDLLFLGPITNLMRRYVSWFVVDAIITFLSIGVAGLIWRSFKPLDVGFPLALIVALGFAILFSVVGALLGMDRIAWSHANGGDVWVVLFSAAMATAFALLLNNYLDRPHLLPPEMVIFASALACTGFVVARYRTRLISGFAIQWFRDRNGVRSTRERALIIGCGYSGQFVAWLLNHSQHDGAFEVVGFVDDDLYKQGIRFQGTTVVGRRADISNLVRRLDVGVIFFAIHNISAEERQNLLDICCSTSARVAIIPNVLEHLDLQGSQPAYPTQQMTPCQEDEAKKNKPTGALSSDQLLEWLAEMDMNVQLGDMAALRAEISAMRQNIQNQRKN
jgi:lipopolysaccharide/colanic/teichoic acid biosynthesis glycosyltransferase